MAANEGGQEECSLNEPCQSVSDAIEIPCRVVDGEGYRGTALFHGEVPPTEGVWFGVEWDDITRGKHDGCFKGETRYFQCSHPQSGSFIRHHKLSFGKSFYAGLRDRYGDITTPATSTDDMNIDNQDGNCYVLTSARRKVAIEVIGAHKVARKQSDLSSLKEASLSRCDIRGICSSKLYSYNENESINDIEIVLPNLEFLDLSENLISTWRDLVEICSRLPSLSSLYVSSNRLGLLTAPLADDLVTLTAPFSKLTSLSLNNTMLTWDQVMLLLAPASCGSNGEIISSFPILSNLSLSDNHLSILSASSSNIFLCGKESRDLLFPSLKVMNLAKNHVTSWKEVISLLKVFPNLEALILNDNKLIDIGSANCCDIHSNLRSLSLNDNELASWADVDALGRSFPSLSELRLRGNPIMTSVLSTSVARIFAIARLATLVTLNGSAITLKERRDAELYYLKQHAIDWSTMEGPDKRTFLSQHPRFPMLIEQHGIPQTNRNETTASFKSRRLSLTFRDEDGKEFVKKLPSTMTVGKIKGLLQRLLNIDPLEQVLVNVGGGSDAYAVASITGDAQVIWDNDMRDLSFFSVNDGDTILVRRGPRRLKHR